MCKVFVFLWLAQSSFVAGKHSRLSHKQEKKDWRLGGFYFLFLDSFHTQFESDLLLCVLILTFSRATDSKRFLWTSMVTRTAGWKSSARFNTFHQSDLQIASTRSLNLFEPVWMYERSAKSNLKPAAAAKDVRSGQQ